MILHAQFAFAHAESLPADLLDLCEVEPLRRVEPGSELWIPDELLASAYVRIGMLNIVPVVTYDGRYDVWTIHAPLSEGCEGPDLPEEIMV